MGWREKAKCLDAMHPRTASQFFFPSDGAGVAQAKEFCADCPVRIDCLNYAIEERIDHGVFGGASERERRSIARARKRAGAYTTV